MHALADVAGEVPLVVDFPASQFVQSEVASWFVATDVSLSLYLPAAQTVHADPEVA